MRKTIVIGLGNPLLGDDGAGIWVAHRIREALDQSCDREIAVEQASVGGLRLMEMMVGYDRAILIDAIVDWPGGRPGQIHRLTLEDLERISPAQHTASAHDTTLPTALAAGRHMGLHLPDEIMIIAVGAANVLEFNEKPSPEVASALPRASEDVLALLQTDSI